jgi:hypothetical protein
MLRCLDWSAWFCASVGLALLVIGLVLVPNAVGQDVVPGELGGQCPEGPGGLGCLLPGKVCWNGPTPGTCILAGNGQCTCG